MIFITLNINSTSEKYSKGFLGSKEEGIGGSYGKKDIFDYKK